MHSMLNIRVANSYIPYQDLENKQMLIDLLDYPDDFVGHIRRYTDSVTTQMVFGYRSVNKDDRLIKEFYGNMRNISTITLSSLASLVDIFPILRYLPEFLFPIMRRAREQAKSEKAMYVGSWKTTKTQILEGTKKVNSK